MTIPEGYELLSGRSRENAGAALKAAVDRGFPKESVLTQRDGYLIPLGEEPTKVAEAKKAPAKKTTSPAGKAAEAKKGA